MDSPWSIPFHSCPQGSSPNVRQLASWIHGDTARWPLEQAPQAPYITGSISWWLPSQNGDHSKQGCTRRYFDTLCLNDLTSASQLSAIWENGVLLQHECLLTHWYVDTCVRGEKKHHVSSLIPSGNLLHSYCSYWKVPFSSLIYPFEMGKLSIEHWGFVIPKTPSWPLAEAPDHHSNGSPEPPPTKKHQTSCLKKKQIIRDL
jgi:hypothetical protein